MVDSENRAISLSDNRHSAQSHFVFHLALTGAGFLSFTLTVVLVGSILILRFTALLLDGAIHVDPFAPYMAILPGQPSAALAAFACQLKEARMNGQILAGRSSCAIFPEDGFFDLVHVESQDDRITELTFYATHMQAGDMILHRGWYTVKRTGTTAPRFHWEADNYTIEIVAKPFHYQDRIRMVMFSIKL